MPFAKFATLFAAVFVAAMLTVGGGLILSGDETLPDLGHAVWAPFFVIIWLAVRLRERWRK